MAARDSSGQDAAKPRLAGSMRELALSFIALLGTRIRLVGIEIAEERVRLFGMLALALGAMVFLAMGVLVASLLVVAYFWDGPRLQAMTAVALVHFALAAILWWRMRVALASHPAMFEATVAELERDRALFAAADESRDEAS